MALALWICLPSSALAEAWVDAGWQQISANHKQQALAIWQQGLNQLDNKRLLASIGVYAHFPYAIAQLKQVGPAFGAFIVRHQQGGRILYYVLSIRPTPADKKARQNIMADLKQAAGISGILIAAEAATFKSSLKLLEVAPARIANTIRQTMKPNKLNTDKSALSFSINRFEITGNSLVSNDIILMGLRDFYGSAKTRSDLKSVQAQVVEIYRMSGIYNARVSTPQLVDDDTVQITIHEKR